MTDSPEDRGAPLASEPAAGGTSLPRQPSHFLELLPFDDRAALLEHCSRRVLMRRQMLFASGEPRSTVYILRSGRVKLMRRTDSGSDVIITLCGPGELLGYSGLSGGTTRLASAQVVEAGDAHVLDEQAFRALMAERPAIAMAVIETLRWRMESVADSLTDVVSEDVPNRIVRLMRRLAASQGAQRNGDAVLDLRLTHQELANMIGARRQTVTTAINDLHRDGVLRRDQHRVVIAGEPGTASIKPGTPGAGGKAGGRAHGLWWASSLCAGSSLAALELALLA